MAVTTMMMNSKPTAPMKARSRLFLLSMFVVVLFCATAPSLCAAYGGRAVKGASRSSVGGGPTKGYRRKLLDVSNNPNTFLHASKGEGKLLVKETGCGKGGKGKTKGPTRAPVVPPPSSSVFKSKEPKKTCDEDDGLDVDQDGGQDSGDDGDQQPLSDCEIANTEEFPYSLPTDSYTMDMSLAIESESAKTTVVDGVQYILDQVAASLSSCDGTRRRRLNSDILRVVFRVEAFDEECPAGSDRETCIQLVIKALVAHKGGVVEDMESAVIDGVMGTCQDIADVSGVLEVFHPCYIVSSTDSSNSGTGDGSDATDPSTGDGDDSSTTGDEGAVGDGSDTGKGSEGEGEGEDSEGNDTDTTGSGPGEGSEGGGTDTTGQEGSEGQGTDTSTGSGKEGEGTGADDSSGSVEDSGTDGTGDEGSEGTGDGGGDTTGADTSGTGDGTDGGAGTDTSGTGEGTDRGEGTDTSGTGDGTDRGEGTDGSGTEDGTGSETDIDEASDKEDEETKDISAVQAQGTDDEEDRIRASGYIMIAAVALLLLLFLLSVQRRRRSDFIVKHQELEDDYFDDEDDAYLKDNGRDTDDESQDDSPERDGRLGARVLDGDSIMSGWTGLADYERPSNSNEEQGLGALPNNHGYDQDLSKTFSSQDVHTCSSATCEICEKRRQSGLQFVPAAMPHHSSFIPKASTRHYYTEDTVNL